MRYVVALGVLAVLLPLICVQSPAAAGDDEVAKLKAKVEQLEAENKSLKEQVAKLTGLLATQKKPPAKTEVVIEIDAIQDISIGGKQHTLSSLRQLFDSTPPTDVVVRTKAKAEFSDSLPQKMAEFLKKNGYEKDSELGNEQAWVRKVPPAKQP